MDFLISVGLIDWPARNQLGARDAGRRADETRMRIVRRYLLPDGNGKHAAPDRGAAPADDDGRAAHGKRRC